MPIIPSPVPQGLQDKIQSRLLRQGLCLVWDKPYQNGYGYVRWGEDLFLVHRVVWTIHNGPIPLDMQVLHNCPEGDNSACADPSHLWLGTQLDNMRDCRNKGRLGSQIHPERRPRGINHYEATTTEETVRLILSEVMSRKSGSVVSRETLARKYSVSTTTIKNIRGKRSWKHVK